MRGGASLVSGLILGLTLRLKLAAKRNELVMAKAGRSNHRYAESKSSVVAAAIAVLNRQGVSRMTLAAVGARLGYSAPTIQYYFNKKEELAAACLMQGIARLGEFLSSADGGSSVRERVGLFLSAYFDFRSRAAQGTVEEFPSFSDARALNILPVYKAYVEMYRRLRGLITDDGVQPQLKLALSSAAHLLLAEVHWTPVWFRKVYPEDSARFGERLFNILVDGIATTGADWTPVQIPVGLAELDSSDGASFEIFLRAACAQINEEGYRGTSVDKIAARINLTKGAFYHHIKTKDEIVLACFERTFDVIRRTIIAAEAVGNTGLQTLATLTTTLVKHQILGNAPLLRASAVDNMSDSDQVVIMTGIDRVVTRIASVISDGIADGSIRSIDAHIGAHAIMALINASDELPYFARGITPVEAVELYVWPVFKGLVPRAQHVSTRSNETN